jgi:hypothetical protein
VDRQRRVEARARHVQPALLVVQAPQVPERVALEAASADLTGDRQRRVVARARLVHPALLLVQVAQIPEHRALDAAVADLSVDRQRRVVARARFASPAEQRERVSTSPMDLRALAGRERDAEHRGRQLLSHGERPAQVERRPRRLERRDRGLPILPGGRSPAGRDQVVQLEDERPQPRHAAVPVERIQRLLRAEGREARAVPLLRACPAAQRLQLLRG